jgi:L-aspartate oxidase
VAQAEHVVRDPMPLGAPAELLPHSVRRRIQTVMDTHAGVLRSAESLDDASTRLAELASHDGAIPSTEDWETTNIHQIASLLVSHARDREETRGSHWREDFPDRDDARWRVRLVSRVDEDGEISTRSELVTGAME